MPGKEAEAEHSLRHSTLTSPFCSMSILQESRQTLSNTHVSRTGIQDLTESISHHLLQRHILRKESVNHGQPAKSVPPPAFVNNIGRQPHPLVCILFAAAFSLQARAEQLQHQPYSVSSRKCLLLALLRKSFRIPVIGSSTGNIADAQHRAVE